MSHRIVFHGNGYGLWAECSCRESDENGWLWLDGYLLMKGAARRAVIKADFNNHVAKAEGREP